jgi:hypothetical protein
MNSNSNWLLPHKLDNELKYVGTSNLWVICYGWQEVKNRVVKLRRCKYGREKPGDPSELWQRNTPIHLLLWSAWPLQGTFCCSRRVDESWSKLQVFHHVIPPANQDPNPPLSQTRKLRLGLTQITHFGFSFTVLDTATRWWHYVERKVWYQGRVANVRDNKDVIPQKHGRGSSARVVVLVHLLKPGRGNEITWRKEVPINQQ